MKSKLKVISSNEKPTSQSLHKGEMAVGKVDDVPNKVFVNDGSGVKDVTGSKVLYFQTQADLDKFIADGKAPEGVTVSASIPEQLSASTTNYYDKLNITRDGNNFDRSAVRVNLNSSDKYLDAKIVSTSNVELKSGGQFSFSTSDVVTTMTNYTGRVSGRVKVSGAIYPLIGVAELYYLTKNITNKSKWLTGAAFSVIGAPANPANYVKDVVALMPPQTIDYTGDKTATSFDVDFAPYYSPLRMADIIKAPGLSMFKMLEADQSLPAGTKVWRYTISLNWSNSSGDGFSGAHGTFSVNANTSNSAMELSEAIGTETSKAISSNRNVNVFGLEPVSMPSTPTDDEKAQIGELSPVFPRFFNNIVLDDYFKLDDNNQIGKIGVGTANLLAVDGDIDNYVSANSKFLDTSRSETIANWSADALSRASVSVGDTHVSGTQYYTKSDLYRDLVPSDYNFNYTITVPATTAGEKVVPDGVWYAVVMDDKAE